MKFRKKSVVVDAYRYGGYTSFFDSSGKYICPDWVKEANQTGKFLLDYTTDNITIKTLEGDMLCHKGDWIIRGVKGELYPCRDDIFNQTYERV